MPPTMHGLRSHLGQTGPLAVFGWRSQSSTGVEDRRWWALQCVPGARADSYGQACRRASHQPGSLCRRCCADLAEVSTSVAAESKLPKSLWPASRGPTHRRDFRRSKCPACRSQGRLCGSFRRLAAVHDVSFVMEGMASIARASRFASRTAADMSADERDRCPRRRSRRSIRKAKRRSAVTTTPIPMSTTASRSPRYEGKSRWSLRGTLVRSVERPDLPPMARALLWFAILRPWSRLRGPTPEANSVSNAAATTVAATKLTAQNGCRRLPSDGLIRLFYPKQAGQTLDIRVGPSMTEAGLSRPKRPHLPRVGRA
jgi:hypothetical protein